MKHLSLRPLLLASAGTLALWISSPSFALEPRTWLSVNGTMIQAELVKVSGDKVQLRTTDGKMLDVPKSTLSFGDLDYIAENAPADTQKSLLGSSGPGTKPKLPNPAKEVKVDTKLFKKEAGDFKINSRTYRVCETPHFKIFYMRPTDPMEMAELAERLWVDTAFFHSTFIPKWHDRKMGIIIVNDQEAYEDVGSWFADMLMGAGNKEGAERMRATWPRSASGTVQMPQADADKEGLFSAIRVFRGVLERKTVDSAGNVVGVKKEVVKGVWNPFRTNTLSGSLLELQSGGSGGAGTDGDFAIFTGHAYYKELSLTGRSETSILGVQGSGKDVGSAGGFDSDKEWAPQLKKMIKKEGKEWEPAANLDEIWKMKNADGAQPRNIVYTYAFSRFLQSSPERLSAYNRLCAKIDIANQVPDLEDIAKLYGYESKDAMVKAWIAWMDSAEFR